MDLLECLYRADNSGLDRQPLNARGSEKALSTTTPQNVVNIFRAFHWPPMCQDDYTGLYGAGCFDQIFCRLYSFVQCHSTFWPSRPAGGQTDVGNNQIDVGL